MSKIYFTSDQHFTDDRFHLFARPFRNIKEMHQKLIDCWNEVVKPEDTVYHVGDFSTTDSGLKLIKHLNGKIHLIKGNYDDARDESLLNGCFESISESVELTLGDEKVFVNHYPEHAKEDMFNIVGHIHGLWRVQRNMINVSCDAWHWYPVSENVILNTINAIRKYYDSNVFAGELESNTMHTSVKTIYAEEHMPTSDFKVFLAGPTPRDKHTRSWRPNMVSALNNSGFRGTVYIPEKRKRQDAYDYIEQVKWEEWALEEADLIIFWVPRELNKMPGFTTNIEFGEWMKSGKIVLGYPESAVKMKYMRHKAELNNIPTYNDMDSLAKKVTELSNKK